jgi:hypothetical protein
VHPRLNPWQHIEAPRQLAERRVPFRQEVRLSIDVFTAPKIIVLDRRKKPRVLVSLSDDDDDDEAKNLTSFSKKLMQFGQAPARSGLYLFITALLQGVLTGVLKQPLSTALSLLMLATMIS